MWCVNLFDIENMRKGCYRIFFFVKKVYDFEEFCYFCFLFCLIISKDFGNKLFFC